MIMRRITLGPDIRSKLHPGDEEIELCDERGATLGYYVPTEFRKMLYALADRLFNQEEIERARAEPGGYTTVEALDYLAARFPEIRQGAERT